MLNAYRLFYQDYEAVQQPAASRADAIKRLDNLAASVVGVLVEHAPIKGDHVERVAESAWQAHRAIYERLFPETPCKLEDINAVILSYYLHDIGRVMVVDEGREPVAAVMQELLMLIEPDGRLHRFDRMQPKDGCYAMPSDAEEWAEHFLYGNACYRNGLHVQLQQQIEGLKSAMRNEGSDRMGEELKSAEDIFARLLELKRTYDRRHVIHIMELARLPAFAEHLPELYQAALHHVPYAGQKSQSLYAAPYLEAGYDMDAPLGLQAQILAIFDKLDAFMNLERTDGAPEESLLARGLVFLATSTRHFTESVHPGLLKYLIVTGILEEVTAANYHSTDTWLDAPITPEQHARILERQHHWFGQHEDEAMLDAGHNIGERFEGHIALAKQGNGQATFRNVILRELDHHLEEMNPLPPLHHGDEALLFSFGPDGGDPRIILASQQGGRQAALNV
jgi:hypothetical protein